MQYGHCVVSATATAVRTARQGVPVAFAAARDYTLADHFFMGAFGGSYLNHQYLICACAPRHASAPDTMRAQLDKQGQLLLKPGSPSANVGAVQVANAGQVTPDGWSVNTSQPAYQPSGVPPAVGGSPEYADPLGNERSGQTVPPLTTIRQDIAADLRFSPVSWAYFLGYEIGRAHV